jgi:hypothetical protein
MVRWRRRCVLRPGRRFCGIWEEDGERGLARRKIAAVR